MNGRTLKSSLTALAVTVVLSGASLNANALALGEINVYSALGQPFRAEVDVTQLSAEEANSLKANIGSAASYRSAGVEYNPAVSNIRVSVQKRANGKTFLRLSSIKPIHEPYLGIVVDTNWAAGRVVRDFTVLLDPPEIKRMEVSVTEPQVNTQSTMPTVLPPVIMESSLQPPAPVTAAPASPSSTSAAVPDSTPPATRVTQATKPHAEREAAPAPKPTTRSQRNRAARAAAEARASSGSGESVKVQRGDTAGRLAAANMPEGVSLDQMLVAMLRANPKAFIGGNVNLLRSGAVLQMPTAEEASAVTHQQARRTVVAQSRDFNRYRQSFARQAPQVHAADAGQSTAGSVTTNIKAPAAVTPDGNRVVVSGSTADAQRAQAAAQQAEKKEQLSRVDELNRTKKELEALSAASQAGSSNAASGSGNVAPGLTLPLPSAPTAPAIAAAPSASTPAAVQTAATTAPAPEQAASESGTAAALLPVQTPSSPEAAPSSLAAASDAAAQASMAAASSAAAAAQDAASAAVAAPAPAPKPKPRPVPPPPPEPSFMDGVMENPLPWGLGGLAILGGLGYFLSRRRKPSTANASGAADSEFLESRLPNDSFFGTSGGQQINTQAATQASATSMAYSPSQLDAAGDVDPVAEADVYLAYGRDMQAEEILKEALLTTPDRIAVHRKLLEIYAKRRDAKAFEELASQLHSRTGGQGEDWSKVAELGNELDPSNPLYRGGPSSNSNLLSKAGPVTAAVFGSSTLPSPDLLSETQNAKLDLELSGDSRLLAQNESDHLQKPRNGAELAAFSSPPSTLQPEDEDTRDQPLSFDLDFDLPASSTPTAASSMSKAPAAPVAASASAPALDDFDLDDFKLNDFNTEPVGKTAATSPAPLPADNLFDADFGNMDFLSSDTVPAPIESPLNTEPATLAGGLRTQDGMLEFDMGALSLNPDSRSFDGEDSMNPTADDDDDHIATKLSLAREFHSIGDTEGARALVKEVIAEADGAAKARAERFLAELS